MRPASLLFRVLGAAVLAVALFAAAAFAARFDSAIRECEQ